MFNKKSIRDLNPESIKGKKVFVRVDYNVPMENGVIINDKRIQETLPTIRYLQDCGAKIILCSHLGRPQKKCKEFKKTSLGFYRCYIESLSLAPVARRLAHLLKEEVKFVDDTVGPKVENAIDTLKDGEVLLLENVRFYKEETECNEKFAKALVKNIDIYVNDAFATSHRKHASTYLAAKFVDIAVAGHLLEKEIKYLEKALKKPARPMVLIIGGAKVSGKLEVLENILNIADKILIGGGMAYTFLKALGYNVGKSLVEEELIDTAKKILKEAEEKNVKVYLPVDSLNASEFSNSAQTKLTTYKEIPDNMMGLDIGPATAELFKVALLDAGTILWNGPMGVFELDKFRQGTLKIAQTLAQIPQALKIVGGGDSVAALELLNMENAVDHISTGGGAFLEFLAGKELPGISVLNDK